MVIVVGNFRGGIGKTTTTVNLAYCFAKMGKRTLVIDADPQCNATPFYKKNMTDDKTLLQAISEPEQIMKFIKHSKYQDLDILGGNRDLMGRYLETGELSWMSRAKEILDREYDIILIDTNPDLSSITVSTLLAADMLLTPIALNTSCRDNLSLLEENIDDLISENGLEWKVFAMGVNMRRRSQRKALEDIAGKHMYPLMEHYVTSSADVDNAWDLYKPVSLHRSRSTAAADFWALAEEILSETEV